jgi:hypothetical protein
MTLDSAIAVRNPADLVDATPYVIGFHPTESLVVLGLSGNRVFFGARYDLPPPDGDDIVQLGAVIAAQRPRCVALLAYGPPSAVDAVITRALSVLHAFRVRVLEALRVHDGRWWSYFCSDPGCCPAEGTPFDTATSLIAAEATFRGQVALPSRQALVAQVAAVDGEARQSMRAATGRARSALDALLAAEAHSTRATRRAGRLAIREAEKRYRSGRALTDDEVAWLGVLLIEPDVHEYALGRLGDEEWRLALWTDVLRRVEPLYAPAAGCVLSYLAWRAGQGALARVAVDRALQAQPQHQMAGLLDEVLGMGIGPHAMSAFEAQPRPTVILRTGDDEEAGNAHTPAPTAQPSPPSRPRPTPSQSSATPSQSSATPSQSSAAPSQSSAAPSQSSAAPSQSSVAPSRPPAAPIEPPAAPGESPVAAGGSAGSAVESRSMAVQPPATPGRSGASLSPEQVRPPRRKRSLRRSLRRRSK